MAAQSVGARAAAAALGALGGAALLLPASADDARSRAGVVVHDQPACSGPRTSTVTGPFSVGVTGMSGPVASLDVLRDGRSILSGLVWLGSGGDGCLDLPPLVPGSYTVAASDGEHRARTRLQVRGGGGDPTPTPTPPPPPPAPTATAPTPAPVPVPVPVPVPAPTVPPTSGRPVPAPTPTAARPVPGASAPARPGRGDGSLLGARPTAGPTLPRTGGAPASGAPTRAAVAPSTVSPSPSPSSAVPAGTGDELALIDQESDWGGSLRVAGLVLAVVALGSLLVAALVLAYARAVRRAGG